MRSGLVLLLFLPLGLAPFGAGAIDLNPIDPELPLTTHAQVFCLGNEDPIAGDDHATCMGVRIDESPETLSSVIGTSEATADLRTGTLRPQGVAHAYWFGEDQLRAGALGSATFYDTITIGGGFTGSVEIRVRSESSFATTDANPNVMGGEVAGLLLGLDGSGSFVGSTGVIVDQYNDGTVEITATDAQGSGAFETNADPLDRFDPADVRFTLSVSFPVDPAHPTFSFLARHSAGTALGFTEPADVIKEARAEGTAQLEVVLPEHVPWSSASGVLLAPEPDAGALGAAALTVLALGAVRRSASAGPSPSARGDGLRSASGKWSGRSRPRSARRAAGERSPSG
jgi:hypothetical protein